MKRFSAFPMRVGAAVAALVFLTACGSDSDDTDITGVSGLENWSATVTGAAAGSYKGFSSQSVTGGSYNIAMVTADTKFGIVITRTGTRPATGTITLSATPGTSAFSAVMSVGPVGATTIYNTTSGTVTITSSTSSEIKGTFAVDFKQSNGTATSHATGSFTSTCPTGNC